MIRPRHRFPGALPFDQVSKAPAGDRVRIEESRTVVCPNRYRLGISILARPHSVSTRVTRTKSQAHQEPKGWADALVVHSPFHGLWPPGRVSGHASFGRAQHRQRRSRRATRRLRRARPALLAPRLRVHPSSLAPRFRSTRRISHKSSSPARSRRNTCRSTIPLVHDSARSCGRAWTAFSRTSIRPRRRSEARRRSGPGVARLLVGRRRAGTAERSRRPRSGRLVPATSGSAVCSPPR